MPEEGAAVTEPKDTPVKPQTLVTAALEKAKAGQVMGDDAFPTVKLVGHPAEKLGEEEEGEEKEPGEAGETGPEGEEEGKEETPEKGEGGEKKPSVKHTNLEEADRAVKAAERKMHDATTEAANLRKENEGLRSRVDDMQVQLTAIQQQVQERAAELSEEEESAIMQKGLKEMQELDTSDPEYLPRMSKIWASTLKKLNKLGDKSVKQAAKEVVKEVLEQQNQEATAQGDRHRLWDKANKQAAKAGLEMEDAGATEGGTPKRSDDYLLFWRTAPDAPENLDEDGKIEWTIKEVKRITGRKVKAVKEQEAKARQHQERQTPLGRAGGGPDAAPTDKSSRPLSLNDALQKNRAKRVI
jgi:hypothetical protein